SFMTAASGPTMNSCSASPVAVRLNVTVSPSATTMTLGQKVSASSVTMSIRRGMSVVPGVKPSAVAVGIGDEVAGSGVGEDSGAGVAWAVLVGTAVCVGAAVDTLEAVALPVGVDAAVGCGGRKVNPGCVLVHAAGANAAIAKRIN